MSPVPARETAGCKAKMEMSASFIKLAKVLFRIDDPPYEILQVIGETWKQLMCEAAHKRDGERIYDFEPARAQSRC
jgi:hypothetical protein